MDRMTGSEQVDRVELQLATNPRHQAQAACAIVKSATERLQASPYFPLRGIQVDYHEGALMLRGSVPSYYFKQLAQEAIRKITGVEFIINALEVRPPGNGLQRTAAPLAFLSEGNSHVSAQP